VTPNILWVSQRHPLRRVVSYGTVATGEKLLPNDRDNQTEPFVLRCCRCGRSTTTTLPPSKDARYVCCAGWQERSSKRIPNEGRNAAIRHRLNHFLGLSLEGHEPEWFDLAQELKVDAVTVEALVAVVQEGKWQKSSAPLTCVRTNVERRSQQLQDPFTKDGRLKREQIFSAVPTREDRAQLSRWISCRKRSEIVTCEDIEAASKILSIVVDEDERRVLEARAKGITRARYLSGVSDLERRKRAAAWRRLNRHGLPSELRRALREVSGDKRIIRPGFEYREWQDRQDALKDERQSIYILSDDDLTTLRG
jgi:hypothetical protein